MPDPKQPYIGGQAVIEGVMMRAPGCMSVAVRRPDGSIVLREGPMVTRFDHKPWKWPGFRGVATLVESMRIGFSALMFSAEQQMTEEEKAAQGEEGKLVIVFAVLFALGLFVALPQLLASGSSRLFGLDLGLTDASYHFLIGGFKLFVFVCYLGLISRNKEIRRTFEYHGAEHKTIHAYEAGLPMTVENVQAQTTLHPRCGTTFLVVVILISIAAGILAAPLMLPEGIEGVAAQALLLAIRIGLLPVIAAISYELQRLSARYCLTGPLRVFLMPGFLFQKITTREPTDDQVEIAIAAMQAAAWRTAAVEGSSEDAILEFPSFGDFVSALPSLRATAEGAGTADAAAA